MSHGLRRDAPSDTILLRSWWALWEAGRVSLGASIAFAPGFASGPDLSLHRADRLSPPSIRQKQSQRMNRAFALSHLLRGSRVHP